MHLGTQPQQKWEVGGNRKNSKPRPRLIDEHIQSKVSFDSHHINAVQFPESSSHRTRLVPDYRTVPILTEVLTCNFLFQPSENVPLSVIIISSQKGLAF
jgi:hypothetical protein